MPNPEVITIMNNDDDGARLVKFAQEKGAELYRQELKSTQIRNLFTEARRIEALWQVNDEKKARQANRQLAMLKPKLAYQAKRHEKTRGVKTLADILTDAINEIEKAPVGDERHRKFERFMELFEAILAYHRAASN
jgi:CRISPR-associated protein Csm2